MKPKQQSSVALNLRIPSELKDRMRDRAERLSKATGYPISLNQYVLKLLEKGMEGK